MLEQTGALIMWGGVISWIAAAIVLSWPYRRQRHFIFHRQIAAPRQKVWDTYHIDLDEPRNAAIHDTVVSDRPIGDSPAIQETVLDPGGRHGTELPTPRYQVLAALAPEVAAHRICEVGGKPYPYGRDQTETLELSEHPDGTLATYSFHGETATLWQFLGLWHELRRRMHRLAKFCESDDVARTSRFSRSFWASLALSLVAVGGFAAWLGWVGAMLLAGVLVLHEFGHWFAMRLTGQPAPRIMLIPFLGGMAVGNHPHKTQFDDAFCALMGPGISVPPCLAFLAAAVALGPPDMAAVWAGSHGELTTREALAVAAVVLTLAIGVLNLLQLLPVLPLDGGQILRSMTQSFSARWARWLLLCVTGLGMASFLYLGDFILAGVLGLGVLQAWYMGADAPKARPMGMQGLCAIGLGYTLTVAVHAVAVAYGIHMFGIEFA